MIHRIGCLLFVVMLACVGFGQECENGKCPLKRVAEKVVESPVVHAVLHPFESIRDRCDYQTSEAFEVQAESVPVTQSVQCVAALPRAACVAQSVRRYASWPVRALRCRR
jgi:hypothetical protein